MSALSFAFARDLLEAYLVEAGYRRAMILGKLAYLGILYAILEPRPWTICARYTARA